ncbi:hypothetical protein Tco_0750537 [Tanacetum coccineum]|uniref:Uncharacterized protein n=1 Tax=Tanacetum coccineum TaxID=301880 RepID=A0ABQ4Z2Z1_9ASTR
MIIAILESCYFFQLLQVLRLEGCYFGFIDQKGEDEKVEKNSPKNIDPRKKRERDTVMDIMLIRKQRLAADGDQAKVGESRWQPVIPARDRQRRRRKPTANSGWWRPAANSGWWRPACKSLRAFNTKAPSGASLKDEQTMVKHETSGSNNKASYGLRWAPELDGLHCFEFMVRDH